MTCVQSSAAKGYEHRHPQDEQRTNAARGRGTLLFRLCRALSRLFATTLISGTSVSSAYAELQGFRNSNTSGDVPSD